MSIEEVSFICFEKKVIVIQSLSLAQLRRKRHPKPEMLNQSNFQEKRNSLSIRVTTQSTQAPNHTLAPGLYFAFLTPRGSPHIGDMVRPKEHYASPPSPYR